MSLDQARQCLRARSRNNTTAEAEQFNGHSSKLPCKALTSMRCGLRSRPRLDKTGRSAKKTRGWILRPRPISAGGLNDGM
eukprot:5864622-Alexandrium_andersonii.AAC.1